MEKTLLSTYRGAMTQTTINFPKLHTSQRMVADSQARYRVLAAGRRWGKSRLGSALCVKEGLFGGRAWWIAPSYKVAAVGWRMIRRLGGEIPGVHVRRVDRMIEFPGGGEVQVRSADDPDSLRGEGLNLAVMDEFAFMKPEAWEILRPALSDRQGDAVFISTPSGRNLFWRLYQRGLTNDGEWQSWRLPTSDNPYIPDHEIEAAKRSLPTATFEQEYEAAFLENEGAVFRNIQSCMDAETTTPEEHKGHHITAGVDWAKQADFTAISIGCAECGYELDIDRFNQIDYHVQWQMVKAMFDKWGVTNGVIEVNSIGEPAYESLVRSGLPVSRYETTFQSKRPLIENLVLIFQDESFQFIDNSIWTGELEAYEQTVDQLGRSKYSAPQGMHDDTVIARALMAHGATKPRWLIY
jgi:phage terminase large subunit-like protein